MPSNVWQSNDILILLSIIHDTCLQIKKFVDENQKIQMHLENATILKMIMKENIFPFNISLLVST